MLNEFLIYILLLTAVYILYLSLLEWGFNQKGLSMKTHCNFHEHFVPGCLSCEAVNTGGVFTEKVESFDFMMTNKELQTAIIETNKMIRTAPASRIEFLVKHLNSLIKEQEKRALT